MMRRWQERRAEGDAGFSLVEMLVVIILLGIVGTIITNSIISAMKTARVQDDETRTLVEAKVAMERITREIRGANALVTCQPRLMSFTETRNNVRTAFTFSVSADSATASEITEDVTTTNLITSVTTTSHVKVLRGLAIDASDAVFTYGDADGNLLTPDTTSPVTYNPGAAKTVGVKVLMRRINGAPSVQLYQLVSIRNFEV